jgi:hypothetical protein
MLGDFKSILFIQSFISICQQNVFLIIHIFIRLIDEITIVILIHHVQTVSFLQRLGNTIFKHFSISTISNTHSTLFKSTVGKGFKHQSKHCVTKRFQFIE